MSTVGAAVASTPLDFGRYHVVQTNILPTSAMLPRLRDGQERFDHISGPFCVSGFVDVTTLGVRFTATVYGITLGNFSGNLKEGLHIDFSLISAPGSLSLYSKASTHELRMRGHVLPDWCEAFSFDEKVLCLQPKVGAMPSLRRMSGQRFTLLLRKGNDIAYRLHLHGL